MSSRSISSLDNTPFLDVKALILAGGKGTRLRPLTYAMAKQLVPVANKPILHYAMDGLYEGGIRQFGIIISPETGEDIKRSLKHWEETTLGGTADVVSLEFIVQDRPAGLAHAVKIAEPYLGQSPFMMYLGDNLINSDLRNLIEAFKADQCDASLLLKPVSNPSSFGVAELDENHNIIRLVEKPSNPPSNLALVGVYLFTSAIFRAIEQIQPSPRGELEITDAIQKLIEQGQKVKSQIHEGWWLDTGKKDDMLAANQTVLSELKAPEQLGSVSSDSEIKGSVAIGVGSILKNCRVLGPAKIGENCHLENTTIGPYTSIGNGCKILDSEIQNSVILEECVIKHITQRIEESLIGQGCLIERNLKHSRLKPNSHQFLLADHSEIQMV